MKGAMVAFFHGCDRVTEDVDMWIDDTPDKRKN